MKYLIDWDKVRNDVDIEEYFLFKMGNVYQFDRYKQAYVFHENGKSGDIIRFFRHEQSRIKMYYSIMNQDSGDIIQFIKKRVINNSSATPEEINNEIRSFVGSSSFIERKELLKRDNQSKFTDNLRQKYEVYGSIIQNIDIHKEYLENFRKISPKAYLSEEFKDVLFTYADKITSLSFFLYNISGDRVGINRIFTGKGEYFNKKWFDANSKNSEGFTFSNKPVNTETLSIFESVFDALSFHEIHNKRDIQYVSSNGELSFKKAKNIKTYFDEHNYRSLILGNDNDGQGAYFNLNVTANFIDSVKSVRKNPNLIFLQIIQDEKVRLLRQFFRRLDKIPEDYKDENLDMNYYEDPDKNLVFMVATKKESIKFFVGLLLKIWNLEKKISIYTPINKDFNEDLIKSKTPADE